ncbi:MAG: hypothetical protein RLZZ15_4463 [Verrucomicrobiota bacterium]
MPRQILNLLCLCGLAQRDWTADSRLHAKERVDPALLFRPVIVAIDAYLPAAAPFVGPVDDALVRNSGTHIHGVGWKRDPLGPKFLTDFVRGRLYLRLCAAWPGADGRAHLLPVDFTHAPTPPEPPKNAAALQRLKYREPQTSSASAP